MGAKISHLALLPQGQVGARRARRARWSSRHDAEGFGSCSNEGECEAVCPKEIPISNIARMTREYVLKAIVLSARSDQRSRSAARSTRVGFCTDPAGRRVADAIASRPAPLACRRRVLGAHEQLDAVGQRHVRPQPAGVIAAQHRFDAGRFERRVRELGLDAVDEGLDNDQIHFRFRFQIADC